MEIEAKIADAKDSSEIRHLLENSKRAFVSFGGEDLLPLLKENPFVVARTGPLVWGVMGCVVRERGWADVRAAGLLKGWRYENAAGVLMPLVKESLLSRGCKHILGIAQEGWLNDFFSACGFEKVDDIVVYVAPVSGRPERHSADIIVRKAESLESLHSLDERTFDPIWGMGRKDLANAVLLGGAAPFVAYHLGEPAGYVLVSAHQEVCEIVRLGVVEEHRRLGIGKALLHEAMRFCESSGTISAILNTQKSNEQAQKLYRSFGFRCYGSPLPVWTLEI